MAVVILRRKRLGKGSTAGIVAFSTTGIQVVRNWVPEDAPPYADYTFRWGCTSNIPEEYANVVNTAKAIHWCGNKKQGRMDMQAAGVPVPETWIHYNDVPQEAIDAGLVMRPATHAQGRNLHVCRSYNDMHDAHHVLGRPMDYYIARLIPKVAEYRVMVVSNRVAWVAKKTPGNPEDVAWNVAQGGRFDNVKWGGWPDKVIKAALAAARVGGLDFCGVDVMVDAEGLPYVLEVNSAPSQTSPYRQQCLAKCFDYIATHGKAHFPDPTATSWKKTIHPAVWST